MAIQDNIEQKVEKARKAGYSDEQISSFYKAQGMDVALPPVKQGLISKIGSDIATRASDVVQTAKEGATKFMEATNPLEAGAEFYKGVARTTGDIAGTILSPVTTAIGAGLEQVGKLPIPGGTLGEFAQTGIKGAGEDLATILDKIPGYSQMVLDNPQIEKDIERALNVLALKGVTKVAPTEIISKGKALVETGGERVKSLFTRSAKTIEEVAQQADEALGTVNKAPLDLDGIQARLDKLLEQGKTAEARVLAEATAPKISISEKIAGVRPDIKARIQGKPDLMREYFDVSHTRYNSDSVPTAFEHGADYARKSAEIMQKKLDETGGVIGNTRKKLATYEAGIDNVAKVENTFNSQLDRLNLEIKDGVIRQKAGKVTRVNSDAEIKALNDLYGDLQTVKQNPNLEKLIDLRNLFDNKINFAKSAREVSSSLDPLSRTVRKEIADVSAEIVGKSEAANLKKFSDFMDAYNKITSYTDRKAGGEFLLREVLSGRGGEARQIIATIKEFTGIDLMDHATMMQVATEVVGNPAEQTLFRQQITGAGLDVASALGGSPGAILRLLEIAGNKTGFVEKQFMKAAE